MSRDELLPIPDYDQLSVDTVREVIRTLDHTALGQLMEYETGHADRPLVKQVLATRMSELESGATPSGGEAPPGPQPSGPPSDTQRVRPETQAPPSHAARHGVPTSQPKPRQGPAPG